MSFISRLALIILLTFMSAPSCRIQEDDKYSDEDLIHYLLNSQRYVEALAVIQEIYPNSQEKDKLNVLWASALSGSVGLDMIDRFSVFKSQFFDQKANDQLPEKGQDPDEVAQGLRYISKGLATKNLFEDFEKELLLALMQGEETLKLLRVIPYFQKQEIPVLEQALVKLGNVPVDSFMSDTAQVYSAILNLCLFVSFLRNALPYAELGTKSLLHEVSCRVEVRNSLNSFDKAYEHLVAFFSALAVVERQSNTFNYENLGDFSQTLSRLDRFKDKNVRSLLTAEVLQRVGKFYRCEN